jgi:hypothetical protein
MVSYPKPFEGTLTADVLRSRFDAVVPFSVGLPT